MIVVYPIGIPAVFAWLLFSTRDALAKVSAGDRLALERAQPIRDLWEPYKARVYYFEVVECGRRIILTGLGAFLFPGSSAQVALEVVFAAVFIAVSEMLSPFVDPLDAWLYRSGTWVVFFSMYLALLLKVDVSDEDSQSQQVFAKILIAANVGLVLLVLVQAYVSAKKGLESVQDLPFPGRKPSRRLSFAQVCDEQVDDRGECESAPWENEAAQPAGTPGCTERPVA